MIVPIKVLGDRVLVKPDRNENAPEATESGVILAATLAAAVTGSDPTLSVSRGTVAAVGRPEHPLRHEAEDLAAKLMLWSQDDRAIDAAAMLSDLVRILPSVHVGDDVLFSHDAGQQITIENEIWVILHEHELLAVVEPEKELTHG